MDTLDIVTPLLRSDYDRYKLQLRTLQEFWKIPGQFHVLVHKTEAGSWLDELAMLDPRIELHFQEDMITPLAVNLSGWYVQQLAKLAASAIVRSEVYLCLDADTVLGRTVTLVDLAPNGKPLYHIMPLRHCSHLQHVEASAVVLQYSFGQLQQMSEMSSKLMRVGVVAALQMQLENVYKCAWDVALVRAFVVAGLAWCEYPLYHVELERTGMLAALHTPITTSLNGSYFWDEGQHTKWHLALQGAGPFVLCGSKAGLSAHWVRGRLVERFPFLKDVQLTTDTRA